jgi:uncharacterized membrane-anchored protein
VLRKKFAIPAFAAIILLQLFVPAKMIIDREEVLENGRGWKFKTEPVDPSDPFRGEYVQLRFSADTIVSKDKEWKSGEIIYVKLSQDKDGFAMISGISENPMDGIDFVRARVTYQGDRDNVLHIRYPFERFYMEESEAGRAERNYQITAADTGHVTYALVQVYKGSTVLKDLFIDSLSISGYVQPKEKSE